MLGRASPAAGVRYRQHDRRELQAEPLLAAQRRAPVAEETLVLRAGIVRQDVDPPDAGAAQALAR